MYDRTSAANVGLLVGIGVHGECRRDKVMLYIMTL